MIILRVKTDDGVTTFPFHQVLIPGTTPKQARDAELEAANKAADYVMKTSAAGFIAEAESVNSTTGKILKKWDHSSKNGYSSLHYIVQSGAYKDTISATLGTEEECLAMAEECNSKCQGWFDRSASVEHIVGPLWQTKFTDPYLD